MTFFSWWHKLVLLVDRNSKNSRRGRRARSRKPIRKRSWLFVEMLEDRFAPATQMYGMVSLGAPLTSLVPGQTVILPVNFSNTTSGGVSTGSSNSLESAQIFVSFDPANVSWNGGSSPILGKLTSEPGINPLDTSGSQTYKWIFDSNAFVTIASGPANGVEIAASHLGTHSLPDGTSDFGTGSVFLLPFTVGATPGTTIINLQADYSGIGTFHTGNTQFASDDPTTGAANPNYILTGGISNDPGDPVNATLTIANLDNTTTVTSSNAGPNYGSPVTLTATLDDTNISDGTFDGTVTFYDNGTSLGTGIVTDQEAIGGNGEEIGTASFTTNSLLAGNHLITAVYGGGSSYFDPSSGYFVQSVNQATTTVAQTAAPTQLTVPFGEKLTFTGTVTNTGSGAAIAPSGTIAFLDSTTTLSSSALVNSTRHCRQSLLHDFQSFAGSASTHGGIQYRRPHCL